MKVQTFLGIAAGAAVLALGTVQGGAFGTPATAATPPPTPPPIAQPAASPVPAGISTPIPLPSGYGAPAQAPPAGPSTTLPAPSGTPSPPPDARKGIEGVWEVQIQRGDKTEYTHFKLAQSGTSLTGTYLDASGKRYPLAGSLEGQAVRLIVSLPDGTTLLMEGRLDGTSDMLGMVTSAKENVPFTAAYRPKSKWIENVNPAPGGVPGAGGGGGPGGGGGAVPPR